MGAKRKRNEILRVELVGAGQAVVWVAHDPYASYSRSVGPFVRRNGAAILDAVSQSPGGAAFVQAAVNNGWVTGALRFDAEALGDGRAVTGYELEAQ